MIKQVLLVVLAAQCFVFPAVAQQSAPIVVGEQFVIHSDVLDEDRGIVISLPPGYAQGTARYPVIYLLDGPRNLNHTTGSKDVLARSNRMPQMIIVGIGNTDRPRDMTPSRLERLPTSGGADAFLSFIKTELIPHLKSNYRTHPYRVLIGHSLGGLFVIHAMINEPDTFDAYLSISPNLSWDNSTTIEGMSTFLDEHRDYRGSLYVTLANEGGTMRSSFDSFVARLESHAPDQLQWGSRLLLDEDHGSTVVLSTYHGLKELFSDWPAGSILAAGNLDTIKQHFATLAAKYGFEIKAPEIAINNLGYRFLRGGDLDKAIDIFKFNIESYPDSANVYDSLGEAYEKSGQMGLALVNYEKAYKQGQKINDPSTPIYRSNYERVSQMTDV